MLHKRLRTFASTIRKSMLSSVGDTDRVVDWILRDAPKAGFNVLCTMVRCLMSRVSRDRENREDMMITSLKTWCDDVDMLTAFWEVDVEGLRCLDVPVVIEKTNKTFTKESESNTSTKESESNTKESESEDENVMEKIKRSSTAESTNNMTLDQQLFALQIQKDHSSEELADDYDDDDDEEDKELQFSGATKNTRKSR